MSASTSARRMFLAVRPLLPWLAAALFLLSLGGLGSRLLNPLPASAYSPVALGAVFLTEILLAATALWAFVRFTDAPARPVAAAPALPDPPVPLDLPPAPVADTSAPSDEDPSTHPLVVRVRNVLKEFYSTVYIVAGSVQIKEEDTLRRFVLKNRTAGGFGESADVEKLFGRVTRAIPGVWNLAVDTISDALTITLKDGFPRAVSLPIPEQIAMTPKQALLMHSKHRLRLGVDEQGDVLSLSMKAFPHFLIVGGTGSGKSVFVRTVIEDFRAAGWMIMLGDGKTTDYTGLIGCPNIVQVSQSAAMHVRTVRMFADEIRARMADARRNQRNNPDEPPFNRPPMLLLLDEFASMIDDIANQYGKEEFEEDMLFIGRMGRQFRCHLAIATQEVYRGILPGPLLGAMKAKISLGPPEEKTIQEVFPQSIRREAKRVGGSIDKERDPGRGLVVLQDDKTGAKAVEFQSFYGYSPADPELPPPMLQEEHDRYRDEVSSQVPKLYPRLAFAVEGPDYGQDLAELYQIPVVLLDGPDGYPDPANEQYDPLSDHWNGNADDSAATPTIPDLSEMQEGRTMPRPRPIAPAPPDFDPNDIPPWEELPLTHGADAFDSPGPPPDFAQPRPAEPAIDLNKPVPDAVAADASGDDSPRPPRSSRNTGVVSL